MSDPTKAPTDVELKVMLEALRRRGLGGIADGVLETAAAERERLTLATSAALLAGYLHGIASDAEPPGDEERSKLLQAAATLARLGGSEELARFVERGLPPAPSPGGR